VSATTENPWFGPADRDWLIPFLVVLVALLIATVLTLRDGPASEPPPGYVEPTCEHGPGGQLICS
jgi:hypothetical protein